MLIVNLTQSTARHSWMSEHFVVHSALLVCWILSNCGADAHIFSFIISSLKSWIYRLLLVRISPQFGSMQLCSTGISVHKYLTDLTHSTGCACIVTSYVNLWSNTLFDCKPKKVSQIRSELPYKSCRVITYTWKTNLLHFGDSVRASRRSQGHALSPSLAFSLIYFTWMLSGLLNKSKFFFTFLVCSLRTPVTYNSQMLPSALCCGLHVYRDCSAERKHGNKRKRARLSNATIAQ